MYSDLPLRPHKLRGRRDEQRRLEIWKWVYKSKAEGGVKVRRASLLAGLLFYHSRVARVSASSRATCPPSSTRPPPPSPESSSHPVLPRLLLCPNPSASRSSRCASGGGHPSARFSSSRPCPLPRQLLPHVRLLDAAPFAVSILATAPPRSLLRTSLLPGDSAAARTNPVCIPWEAAETAERGGCTARPERQPKAWRACGFK